MQERRWESTETLDWDAVTSLQNRLADFGLKVRHADETVACYLEGLEVASTDALSSLAAWPLVEMTLVQEHHDWQGDFFLLAGQHHAQYREQHNMDSYLSICHPWKIPESTALHRHHRNALFWIGFRDTHAFVRVRLLPRTIITPGESRESDHRLKWLTERASAFSDALAVLDLPLLVEWHQQKLAITSLEPGAAVAQSWPDAFGACQFEYVFRNSYELLVPAARLVEKLGPSPALLKTYLSGFESSELADFHTLQPAAKMCYRGYVHAALSEFPALIRALAAHQGRILINLCEFDSQLILPNGDPAAVVVALMGDHSGYKIEIRFNRAPLAESDMDAWVTQFIGSPLTYAPLSVY